jgi:hypothetical protein
MEKLFVPYDLCVDLMQIGFKEKTLARYRNGDLYADYISGYYTEWRLEEPVKNSVLAPTWDQAFDWFRINHNLDYNISFAGREGEYTVFVRDYIYGNNGNSPSVFSYDEAKVACLDKMIKIVSKMNVKLITIDDRCLDINDVYKNISRKYPKLKCSNFSDDHRKLTIQTLLSLLNSSFIENYNLNTLIPKIEDGRHSPTVLELLLFLAVKGDIEDFVI